MTGGHLASLDHLHREAIDLCAIDCVTWGLLQKFQPADAMHYRILAQTPRSPSPPLVTSITTDVRTVATLRESLDTPFWDPATVGVRETLARISHRIECIGAANQRKSLCCKNLSPTHGAPRCRQSV